MNLSDPVSLFLSCGYTLLMFLNLRFLKFIIAVVHFYAERFQYIYNKTRICNDSFLSIRKFCKKWFSIFLKKT